MKDQLDLAGMTMELGRLIRKKMQQEKNAPSPIRLHALGFLEEHPGIRMSAFASLMKVSPSTATAVVDRLVSTGLVKRSLDPANRRIVCLRLTEKGKTTAATHASCKAKILHDIFGALKPTDRKELARIFRTLLDRIHDAHHDA